MKKITSIIILSLALSVCGGNEESNNQLIITSQEEEIENTEIQASESELNSENSDKISELRNKCEIFTNERKSLLRMEIGRKVLKLLPKEFH